MGRIDSVLPPKLQSKPCHSNADKGASLDSSPNAPRAESDPLTAARTHRDLSCDRQITYSLITAYFIIYEQNKKSKCFSKYFSKSTGRNFHLGIDFFVKLLYNINDNSF